jgi:signal transduction histidine kinase
LPERLVNSVAFNMAIILYDTAWVAATLVLSGRFSAEFFYLYFFVLLLAAIGENLLLIAVGAVALCGAYLYGHIATGGTWSLWHSPSLIRLPFLFATAVFYGYLVDRTRQERRRADENERVSRQLSRTLVELRVLYGKAQEADLAKSEFLATVSHELRTPLVALLGYIDLLLEQTFGPLRADQEDVLVRARKAGGNLHQLITRVLEASHMEFQQEPVRTEECDLDALFAGLQAELDGTESTTVRYPARVSLPCFRTDTDKLRTILRNLIENAIKYTPAGQVTVGVRFDAAHEQVEFEISDTGIGIAAEQLPDVFEAFRQGHDEAQRAGSGVGLGLYIVKRLVDLLGGQVDVESKPGNGSTFRVRLPRLPAVAAETDRH